MQFFSGYLSQIFFRERLMFERGGYHAAQQQHGRPASRGALPPLVYRLAYARTGNHADAEDICQDVFLTLARKNPSFEAEENRCAWLIRVTINRTVSL